MSNAPEAAGGPGTSTSSDAPDELALVWRKIEILGRPLGAFFTALTVAFISILGQSFLKAREQEITERAANEANQRLYTQLVNSREQADTQLRTAMFNTILSGFLVPVSNGEGDGELTSEETPQARKEAAEKAAKDIDARLLKLELLALNFGDSLSVSPLFLGLDREISAAPLSRIDKRDYFRPRLRSLAKRVSSAQVAALAPEGVEVRIEIPLERVRPGSVDEGPRYVWPDELMVEMKAENETAEIDWDEVEKQHAVHGFDDIQRTYSATFSNANQETKTVDVSLTIDTPGASKPTRMSFELDYYNFPMIDNTRLSDDQRFALILSQFDDEAEPGEDKEPKLVVRGICFPGRLASLHDRPFLDDILGGLRDPTTEKKP